MAIKNQDKIAIIKDEKVLNAINFSNKHKWNINNSDIIEAKNLRLFNIKKY